MEIKKADLAKMEKEEMAELLTKIVAKFPEEMQEEMLKETLGALGNLAIMRGQDPSTLNIPKEILEKGRAMAEKIKAIDPSTIPDIITF